MVRSPVAVVVALSLGGAAGLGMARFGYGPLLPSMRMDLGWSLTTAGLVQSANFAGHIGGAALTPRLLARHGTRRVFLTSYLAVGFILMATGSVSALGVHVALRALVGVAGAVLWITGSMIAARLSTVDSSGLLLGLFFAGLGTGVIATALLIPTGLGSKSGWRVSWVVMGALTIAGAPIVQRALAAADTWLAMGRSRHACNVETERAGNQLLWLELAYFLFALGIVIYLTFAVEFLNKNGASSGLIAAFWGTFGICIWISGPVWASAISHSTSGRLVAGMYLIMAASAGLPLISSNMVTLIVSGSSFGSVFTAAVAATTHLIRAHEPVASWTSAMARFTLGFGIAMVIGSAAAGALSDRLGVEVGIIAAGATLTLAALAARLQSDPTLTTPPFDDEPMAGPPRSAHA